MSEEAKTKRAMGEPRVWWILGILAAVVAVLALNWWLLKGDDARGTFGDMFGGVNALFSGAAFSVLAFTLLLQRYELKLQREELAETRKVMEAQRVQMESQARTQQLQQFENTFFQLIKVYGDIVPAFSVQVGGLTFVGRRALSYFAEHFTTKYTELGAADTEEARISSAYGLMYRSYQPQLGPYFRHLYHVLKFIDENEHVDRHRYRAFFRAQLSPVELTLLFYNCLTHHGQNTKPLLERYGILKHLPPEDLIKLEHADFYAKSAFTPSVEPRS